MSSPTASDSDCSSNTSSAIVTPTPSTSGKDSDISKPMPKISLESNGVYLAEMQNQQLPRSSLQAGPILMPSKAQDQATKSATTKRQHPKPTQNANAKEQTDDNFQKALELLFTTIAFFGSNPSDIESSRREVFTNHLIAGAFRLVRLSGQTYPPLQENGRKTLDELMYAHAAKECADTLRFGAKEVENWNLRFELNGTELRGTGVEVGDLCELEETLKGMVEVVGELKVRYAKVCKEDEGMDARKDG